MQVGVTAEAGVTHWLVKVVGCCAQPKSPGTSLDKEMEIKLVGRHWIENILIIGKVMHGIYYSCNKKTIVIPEAVECIRAVALSSCQPQPLFLPPPPS